MKPNDSLTRSWDSASWPYPELY